MTLKQQGAFVCRSLSFQQCAFELVVTPLEDTAAGENYDKVTKTTSREWKDSCAHRRDDEHPGSSPRTRPPNPGLRLLAGHDGGAPAARGGARGV